jgi:hypothetical protein
MPAKREALKLALCTAAVVLAAAGAARAEVTDTRALKDSVRVTGSGPPTVIVRNVSGFVHVTAYDGATVEMTATETVTGDLRADIDRARKEVELRTESEEGRVAFRVRRVGQQGDGEWRWNGWNEGYRVKYDIEVRVPRDSAVEVNTVNDELVVDGVRGHFEVGNVNGGMKLTGLRGSGNIKTVNGSINATFERAPAAGTTFKTVNGKIDVSFPQDLKADLSFKTVHGEIYTDFDSQPLAAEPVGDRSRDGGKLVVRTGHGSGIRIGAGGPAYSFETVNGSVYIRKAAK